MQAFRTRTPLRSATTERFAILKRRDGIEVSIPNIIVAISISVAVLLAAAVGAMAVIPMANDATAKSTIGSVKTAQEIFLASGADPDNDGLSEYATGPQLVAAKYVQKNASAKVTITATGSGATAAFCVAVLSDTGTIWYGVSGDTEIKSGAAAAVTAAGCVEPTALLHHLS